jgi:hypothetical protein
MPGYRRPKGITGRSYAYEGWQAQLYFLCRETGVHRIGLQAGPISSAA